MTNYVENEVITIITHENGKTVPTVKNIATINYGITSGNIAIDEDNGTHGVAFRTSAKQYNAHNEFETVFFDCARGDTVKLYLRKKDGVKYYVDIDYN